MSSTNEVDIKPMLAAVWSFCLYAKYRSIEGSTTAYKDTLAAYDIALNSTSEAAEVERWRSVWQRFSGADAITSITAEQAIYYLQNDVSDTKQVQLLAAVALRSIIGRKVAAAVGWGLLLSRMAGHTKPVQADALPKWVQRWNTRKMRAKLIGLLCSNWGVQYYCPKGFRVGWFSMDAETDLPAVAGGHPQRPASEASEPTPPAPQPRFAAAPPAINPRRGSDTNAKKDADYEGPF